MRLTSLTACALLLAPPAFAATVDAGGTGHGSSSSEAMPIADGLVVVHAQSQYEHFETGSADNPMATATGPCWGSVLISASGVSGGGLCNYTDGDGDHAIMRWTPDGVADGRTMGAWEVVGGTGKWTEITGGGRFDAGTDADGAYSNMITGELTLP